MKPAILFDGPHLRATSLGDNPRRMVVTFDHWRRDRQGFDPHRGSTFVNRGFTHVQVRTRRNDWFLNPDLAALLTRLDAVSLGFTTVLGLGFSMGGYGLALASRRVRFDRMLFVSPHTTPAADLPHGAPIQDRRFAADPVDPAFTREAHDIIRRTPPRSGNCVVLYDPLSAADTRHAAEIERLFFNAQRVPLTGAGHPVSASLPSPLGFQLIVEALLTDPISTTFITATHDRMRRIAARQQHVDQLACIQTAGT